MRKSAYVIAVSVAVAVSELNYMLILKKDHKMILLLISDFDLSGLVVEDLRRRQTLTPVEVSFRRRPILTPEEDRSTLRHRQALHRLPLTVILMDRHRVPQ